MSGVLQSEEHAQEAPAGSQRGKVPQVLVWGGVQAVDQLTAAHGETPWRDGGTAPPGQEGEDSGFLQESTCLENRPHGGYHTRSQF